MTDPDVEAIRICTEALIRLTPRMQRATLEYLHHRFVSHPSSHPRELALRARALLEEAGRVDPAVRFQAMVDAGLIDADGRVTIGMPGVPKGDHAPEEIGRRCGDCGHHDGEHAKDCAGKDETI